MPRARTEPPPQGAAAGLALGLTAVLCWSIFNVAAKSAIDAGLTPLDLALLRFGGAGVVTLPLLLCLASRIERPSLSRTLVLATLGGPLFGALAVAGYQHAPLAHGMTVAPTAVALAGMVLGVGLLGERVGPRALAGVAVALTGLALTTGMATAPGAFGWTLGDVYFAAAGCLWAAYTALMRAWRVPAIGGTLAVASTSAAAAIALYVAFGDGGLFSAPLPLIATQVVTQGLIGGVVSVAAFIAAARLLGAARAALLPALTPCVALSVDAALGGPALSGVTLLGAALVTAGVSLTILDQGRSSTDHRRAQQQQSIAGL